MEALAPFSSTAPDRSWLWRDRTGGLHRPAEMETRHLFHTLRMIWNNTMPAHMRVGAVRLYRFGGHYSDRYLRSAVYQIGRELLGRTDMTPMQKAELAAMEARLRDDGSSTALSKAHPSSSPPARAGHGSEG